MIRAHRAYALYTQYRESLADPDDDDGPQDEDAWLFEDLTILSKMYAQLRDKEQLIALIFEVRFFRIHHKEGPLTPFHVF